MAVSLGILGLLDAGENHAQLRVSNPIELNWEKHARIVAVDLGELHFASGVSTYSKLSFLLWYWTLPSRKRKLTVGPNIKRTSSASRGSRSRVRRSRCAKSCGYDALR